VWFVTGEREVMTGIGRSACASLACDRGAVDDPGASTLHAHDPAAPCAALPQAGLLGVFKTGLKVDGGDRRVRILLYEAANVMLTRYKGSLKLKDWAFAIAKQSTMRKNRPVKAATTNDRSLILNRSLQARCAGGCIAPIPAVRGL